MNRVAAAVTLALLLAAASACGVPTHDTPQPVAPPRGPFVISTSPVPTQSSSGTVAEVVCLVRDDRIVPVVRYFADELTVEAHLRALLDGPTAAERTAGLVSGLSGAGTVLGVQVTGGLATVAVRPRADNDARSDDVLAFGQVVCTLTARRDITGVSFVQDGHALGVPKADGSLSTGPLTTADYASLVTP